jgi:hypothetical protein
VSVKSFTETSALMNELEQAMQKKITLAALNRKAVLTARTTIDDAAIRRCRFVGMTVGMVCMANTGSIHFQDNRVSNSGGGFWQLAIGLGDQSTINEIISILSRYLGGSQMPMQIAALNLALSYPIPSGYTPNSVLSAMKTSPLSPTLLVSSNQVEAVPPSGDSGFGICLMSLASTGQFSPSASVVLTGNRVRNSASTAETATVLIFLPDSAAISGNIMVNDQAEANGGADSPSSLIVYAVGKLPLVSVSGNVLQGYSNVASLLTSNTTAPVNTWAFANLNS